MEISHDQLQTVRENTAKWYIVADGDAPRCIVRI